MRGSQQRHLSIITKTTKKDCWKYGKKLGWRFECC